MAKFFRDSSIRVKLSLIVVLDASLAVLLVGGFLLGYERHELRDAAARELSIQAGIVADNSTAALSFADQRAAFETLAALRADPDLIEAAIYDRNNQLFARFERGRGEHLGPSPSEGWPALLRPAQSGVKFVNGNLYVSQTVLLAGQTIGTVILASSMNQVATRLRRYVGFVCLVLLFSLGTALLLSTRMQRTITGPLAQLSSVARLVAVKKDYSVRAIRHGADEVGFLTDSFNEMLMQIEIREQARRGAEESLRESEERFALAARGANDGLWDWKASTGKMYLSPRGNQMLGLPEVEKWWTAEEWESRYHPGDSDRVRAEWNAVHQNAKGDFVSEYRMRCRNGSFIWVLARGKAVRDGNGRVIRLAGSLTDVTEGKIADPLTGLPNRLYFLDRLEDAIDVARCRDLPFAVLFLDLDRFKLVNDSLGHAAGDELLIEIATRLRTSVQTAAISEHADGPPGAGGSSVVSRLGGDEFAILLHGNDLQAEAAMLAECVLRHLNAPFHIGNRQMFAGVSIGIALSSSGATAEDLLRNADTAMYYAKKAGRARYKVFDEGMREQAIARLELETGLRKAVEDNQLEVWYQPQVSLPGHQITGCEALVRWRHSERGVVPPIDFISIAEETDLIIPLGRWVLGEACRQMADWQRRFAFDPPLTISVNVSFKQLTGAGFVEEVRRILAATELRPGTLRLEMTESTAMTNAAETIDTLRRLKALNVGLEIDDFGTGYSSLSCLNRLPFDTVKIDCSFVKALDEDEESAEIVRAILELARSMNLNVVAEGVETAEQLQRLTSLGCTQAQGYYFSKPLTNGAAALLFEVESMKRAFRLIEAPYSDQKPAATRPEALAVTY
jgi:diguanylate cyclase (GGDEF)-like protein/PAS domain S-box-containing protein